MVDFDNATGRRDTVAPARVDGGPLAPEPVRWPADYPLAGRPDKVALVFDGRATSYADLNQQADQAAAVFEHLGLAAGRRVGYLGQNSAIYFAVLFGAMRAGTILVPLNWRCTPSELTFIIADAGVDTVLCDSDLATLAREAAVDAEVLPIEGPSGFHSLMDDQPPCRPDATVEPDHAAMLMYTSGTTGKPKGVVVTQRMFGLARQAELHSPDYAAWREDDVLLSPMPNFHMAACSWVQCALMRGLTCVITGDPSPGNIVNLCRRHGVTHTFIVPTVVRAVLELLEADGSALPTLREIHYGAAPMDVALLERSMRVIGCGFVHHYGMTENAGTATRLGPRDHDPGRPHLLRSIGRPQPGMEIEIRRADGSLVHCREAGEIWLRSPTITPGYWRRPEATAEAIVDGWYRSGDGGLLDEDGYLYLTDRIKDMIVTGGENVYPVEVEAAIRLHPAVADVVVFGLPDPTWGEVVMAAVELRAGMTARQDELRAHARLTLAGYKVPKGIRFDLVLPRTATGKVQRGAARKAAMTPSAV